jgi:hypothetical protein
MGVWELPAGWKTAKLGDLVEMKTGFACAKKNLVSEGISHLRPFNVGTNGEIDFSTVALWDLAWEGHIWCSS